MYTIDSEELEDEQSPRLHTEQSSRLRTEQDEEAEEDIKKVSSETEEQSTPQRFYKSSYQPDISLQKTGSKKHLFMILILIILAVIVLGVIFRHKINSVIKVGSQPTPTPISTPQPTPTPTPLIRSDWSFEVLNGSGVTGLAKKLADKLTALGYPVVKTANADKDSYAASEIFVKKTLLDKLDTVIVDLKDTIKIASVGGELKEGTASARIIIGKDYNP